MAMAVMGGKYKHPEESAGRWSAGMVGLIDACLKVDPNERPDIHQVRSRSKLAIRGYNLTWWSKQLISMTDKVIAGLQ